MDLLPVFANKAPLLFPVERKIGPASINKRNSKGVFANTGINVPTRASVVKSYTLASVTREGSASSQALT